uniref:Putative secreted protein n=1 Tax=Anopheles marajoara TaxID=58244 RepID=A0A2M4C756_9DIPT
MCATGANVEILWIPFLCAAFLWRPRGWASGRKVGLFSRYSAPHPSGAARVESRVRLGLSPGSRSRSICRWRERVERIDHRAAPLSVASLLEHLPPPFWAGDGHLVAIQRCVECCEAPEATTKH